MLHVLTVRTHVTVGTLTWLLDSSHTCSWNTLITPCKNSLLLSRQPTTLSFGNRKGKNNTIFSNGEHLLTYLANLSHHATTHEQTIRACRENGILVLCLLLLNGYARASHLNSSLKIWLLIMFIACKTYPVFSKLFSRPLKMQFQISERTSDCLLK